MTTTIYCKATAKEQQTYYMTNGAENIMLFVTSYRKSNREYFGGGCNLDDVFKARRNHSASIRLVAERIISAIKYVEKEYGLVVLDQTAKSKSIRLKNKKEQSRRACRGKIDVNSYDYEIAA